MLPTAVDVALTLPPDDAAARLGELPENQWFERKSGVIKPMDLATPLIAMANAEGGIVVVGLMDDGTVSAVSDSAVNALRQVAVNFTRPPVTVHIEELVTSAGRIMVFRVAISNKVHESQKGECFRRYGDSSQKLSFHQRQELEWDRSAASFDGTAAPGMRLALLDVESLEKFQTSLGASSAQSALEARYLLTHDDQVTVAATLLFGCMPGMFLPNAHVRVLRYDENNRGSGRYQTLVDGADVRCEGSIPSQIEQAAQEIERLMPRRRVLTDSGKFDGVPRVPRQVWMEGLVNAVIHRSYSIGGDHIRVEIFPNRLEISSPGRFPGTVNPLRPRSIRRLARNPRIARVCSDLGISQELGEGIRRMCDLMQQAGLNDPLYTQKPESVELTLLASDAVPLELREELGENCLQVLDVLRRAQKPLGTGQVAEAVGFARPTTIRHLRALQEADLVVWEGETSTDPRATWTVT